MPGDTTSPSDSALARLFECLAQEWSVTEVEGYKNTGGKKLFALIRQKTEQQRAHVRTTLNAMGLGDQRDDRDNNKDSSGAYEAGMGPNAGIWRVYLKEATQFDVNMVDTIRDNVDVILVFAGLFSAVVTTLATEVSAALQPDYGQVTAALLVELIAVQRAAADDIPLDTVRKSVLNLDSPPTASAAQGWVAGLWFVSLAFSLSTALLAVLVKQWMQAYVEPTSGTPQDQARLRHFRYMGIQGWHVPLIVGLLPTLLHLSLLLFFTGLVVFLSTLSPYITAFVAIIGVLAYTVYTFTTLVPIWFPQCPYKTPLANYCILIIHMGKNWAGASLRNWAGASLRMV